jgi:hypothetical protein
MASKLLHCLDADQGVRKRGKAGKILKNALAILKLWSGANENQEVSFQPCFLICNQLSNASLQSN